MIPFNVVLLAGGFGSRMQSSIPKQYLILKEKCIVLHSFEIFLQMDDAEKIVVICADEYQSMFLKSAEQINKEIIFAKPGERRQDSVYNAIQKLSDNPLVCIHDGARPFIDQALIRSVVEKGNECGAAAIGTKVKSTIKRCSSEQMILETPQRCDLWEVQTPQVIRLKALQKGFKYAFENHLTVTDDVALVELINQPVKIVEGSCRNIKLTTPEDYLIAQHFVNTHYALL